MAEKMAFDALLSHVEAGLLECVRPDVIGSQAAVCEQIEHQALRLVDKAAEHGCSQVCVAQSFTLGLSIIALAKFLRHNPMFGLGIADDQFRAAVRKAVQEFREENG